MDDTLIPLAAAALVVLSVLFGWWSFRFSEDGATPDDWRSMDPTLDLNIDTEMIEMGGRARARLCARTLFGIAALCLIASIPLGYVDAHRTAVTPLMIGISAAVFVFAVVTGIKLTLDLWRSRRESAFDSFYTGQKIWQNYRNEAAVRRLFFAMNPMPFFSIFKRDWAGGLRYPTAEELLETDAAREAP
jgi:MFS family permease